MKTAIGALWVVLSSVGTAAGAVAVGENFLANGLLEADQVDFPQGWTLYPTRMVRPDWHPTAGPDGMACLTFSNDDDAPAGERSVRQGGLSLAVGGTYRISAQVRPRAGFSAKSFMVGIINKGWTASRGVHTLPPPGVWTRVSETFKGFPTQGGYTVLVSVGGFKGVIDIADIRLEAIDESGAAGAEKAPISKSQTSPRIVPWRPLLGAISASDRKVSFRLLGKLPAGVAQGDCDIVLKAEGADAELVQKAEEVNTFTLPLGADGGEMALRAVNRATGSNIVERAFRYRIVAAPSRANIAKHRRLNNYVTEVVRAKAFGAERERFSFGLARRKWLHVSIKGVAAAFSVLLDGEKILDQSSPRGEVFHETGPGDHELTVSGFRSGDEIVVRAIPETFNYSPGLSVVRENPPFDWNFQTKYALPAVTTMNGSGPPEDRRAEFRARGHRWLANLHTTKPESAEDIAARLASAAGMTDPRYDGLTCDEQFCGRDSVNSMFMLGLRKYDLDAKPSRAIYTWLVGKPMSGIFDPEFIAECANTSLGRGMVLTETYCRSRATESEARVYIENYICEAVRRYRAAWPEVLPSMGMVLGNFTQLPVLSLHHHCGTDYRYFLDMQLNALANDPSMDGIGLAGYWGSYYIDEEMLRWCFMLLRHYCVEGATDMLSARYGLTYNPGFVQNPDFAKGLEGWKSEGNVSTGFVKDFGEKSMGLYGGAGGCGDTFAVFTRSERPGRLSQKISGLMPGKKYVLQFVSFDASHAETGKFAPRKIALSAELGDAASVAENLSWTHVDRRTKTRYGRKDGARVNLTRTVFTARAPELVLSFSDAGAVPGERLGLNWIYFAKYLEP